MLFIYKYFNIVKNIDTFDWGNEVLQEDIIYDRIKNNIDYSDDYIPWRSEIEELYFNPYSTGIMSYDKEIKSNVHEYIANYNSNVVNGLSYKNRFDVKANIAHKIKGEEGDIDEGIIGGGLGVDFESKNGELTEYFDPEKTWFSLQDVMELTLLHAQQLETMNEDYNKQIDELNQKLKTSEEQLLVIKSKKDNSEILDDSLKKIQELQSEINKRNKEIKKLKEENDTYREKEALRKTIKSTPATHQNIEQPTKVIEKPKIPKNIRTYSILNRLKKTKGRQKYHEILLHEQAEKYLRDFEYRLSHEERLRIPNPEYEEMLNEWKKYNKKQLLAEFMPLQPGLQRPQFYKELKLHGIESPWGGKFHINKGKQKEEKGVALLNLYEIARRHKIRQNTTSNND